MTRTMSIVVFAVSFLVGGDLAAQATDAARLGERLQVAQMDSSGDGLDKGAASEGNARPSRMGAPRVKKLKRGKRRS